jgi:hypothetical protein
MNKLLVGLVVVAACHKASEERTPRTADALWALAPEDARLGIVVTPRGTTMLEHGLQDVLAFVQKAPELQQAVDEIPLLRQAIAEADLPPSEYGMSLDRGMAVFMLDGRELMAAVPVIDRDRFLARIHGTKGADADTIDRLTCKPLNGFYVCVTNTSLFDKVGKGKLKSRLESRGDIEIVADHMAALPVVAVALQLERGGVIARGTVAGLPSELAPFRLAPIKPQLDRAHAAGFGVLDLEIAKNEVTGAPVVAGLTDADLVKTLAGPSYMSITAGQMDFDVRIPLLDTAPAQAVIDHCAELLGSLFTATAKDGRCHVESPPLPGTLDAWVDGNTFRVGMNPPPVGNTVTPTRGETALADSAWHVAFWVRGSLLASPALPIPPEAVADPQIQALFRALLMVNEAGVGFRLDGDKARFVAVVRTAFANPDDVVAKLAAVPISDVLAGKGAQAVGTTGSAPITDDMKAGWVPIALLGVFLSSFANGLGH